MDAVERPAGRDALLQRLQVGLGDRLVVCQRENMSVTFTFRPAVRARRMAGMPALVAGILTITFGQVTASARR